MQSLKLLSSSQRQNAQFPHDKDLVRTIGQNNRDLLQSWSNKLQLCFLSLLLLCFGCISNRPTQGLKSVTLAPEKDVLILRIELKGELAPQTYYELALEECKKLGLGARNPHYPEIELYQLIVSFHLANHELAQVFFEQDTTISNAPLIHKQSLVYQLSSLRSTKDAARQHNTSRIKPAAQTSANLE